MVLLLIEATVTGVHSRHDTDQDAIGKGDGNHMMDCDDQKGAEALPV